MGDWLLLDFLLAVDQFVFLWVMFIITEKMENKELENSRS